MMGDRREAPPSILWIYLLGTGLLVLWGFLPSEVESSYSWQGVLLEGAFLAGLFLGIAICRWTLIILGVSAAFGTFFIQGPALEFVATTWSILALLVTSLLLTASVRRYTDGCSPRESVQQVAGRARSVENDDWRRCGRLLLPVVMVLVMFFGVDGAAASAAGTRANGLAKFCSEPPLSVSRDAPFQVRLGMSTNEVAPGGKLDIRVENFGAEAVTYGLAYRLARLEKGIWINQPTGPFLMPLISLRAGSAGPCQRLSISRNALPGKYRILKEVSQGRRSRTLRAFYRVR